MMKGHNQSMTTLTESITVSNEQTPPEFRIVCAGLTINVNNQDLLILDLVKRTERVVGDCYASWTVLFERDSSHRDPWVVWNLIARPDGWMVESGSYCMTEEEGRKAFALRS
jgi:hypothetical protein